jgi:hypothetical protein
MPGVGKYSGRSLVSLLLAIGASLVTLQLFERCFDRHQDQDDPLQMSKTFSKVKPLQVCRQSTFNSSDGVSYPPIEYQCAGGEYDNFTRRMHVFADNTSVHGDTWGRREYPLPDNTTILMLGNSHTRQVGVELACQYSHVLRSMRVHHNSFVVFEFENNSTMYLLTNTPIVYSLEWKNLLEVLLGKKLNDFNAVVLGLFNQYPGKVKTHFDRDMIARSQTMPNVDYTKIKPPTLSKILEEFHGPAVLLSMFILWDKKWIELQRTAARHKPRVGAINARKYVSFLGECGSDAILGNGTCYNDDIDRVGMRRPNRMHRCVGAQGGHPDLVAWDVIEFINLSNGSVGKDE